MSQEHVSGFDTKCSCDYWWYRLNCTVRMIIMLVSFERPKHSKRRLLDQSSVMSLLPETNMGKRASSGRDSSPPIWHAHRLRPYFVVAAIYILVCHFCAKTRLMRQPWNISLSGYNISKLPRSRTRRIAVSGRGSAVQDTEWRLNTLKSFGLISIAWDCAH